MGRVKELLLNQSEYSMSYLLIVDMIKNSDEVIYTIRDLLNDKTYIVSETIKDKRVNSWLKGILLDNGIKYPDPTYNMIIKWYSQAMLYFHAWINDDPKTTADIILIKEDRVKTFFEYERLEIEKLKLDTLKSINQHIGLINKNIDDLINR